MRALGFPVVDKMARHLLEGLSDQQKAAITPESFQRRLVPLMAAKEADCDPGSCLIFDRALPDVLGFLAFHRSSKARWRRSSQRKHQNVMISFVSRGGDNASRRTSAGAPENALAWTAESSGPADQIGS
jgi:hypothetical protein